MHAEKIQHSLDDMFVSVEYCIIIRVHSVFSLVENRDCRLTMFRRKAYHGDLRIFSIDRDHVKWRAKIFSSLRATCFVYDVYDYDVCNISITRQTTANFVLFFKQMFRCKFCISYVKYEFLFCF